MSANPVSSPLVDNSIGYRLTAGALTTFVLVAIAVALRTFARAKYAKIWWNDYLMVIAAVRACPLQNLATHTRHTDSLQGLCLPGHGHRDHRHRPRHRTTLRASDAVRAPAASQVQYHQPSLLHIESVCVQDFDLRLAFAHHSRFGDAAGAVDAVFYHGACRLCQFYRDHYAVCTVPSGGEGLEFVDSGEVFRVSDRALSGDLARRCVIAL